MNISVSGSVTLRILQIHLPVSKPRSPSPGPTWIQKFPDTQVSEMKWGSISIYLTSYQGLPYTSKLEKSLDTQHNVRAS